MSKYSGRLNRGSCLKPNSSNNDRILMCDISKFQLYRETVTHARPKIANKGNYSDLEFQNWVITIRIISDGI